MSNSSFSDRLPKAEVKAHFIRVAKVEWPLVKRFHKTEFRTLSTGAHMVAARAKVPTPVALYASAKNFFEHRMAVLTSIEIESLGAITSEGLAAEDCESFAEFRTKWTNTRQYHFNPLQKVLVCRVRPFDPEEGAELLLEQLYPAEVFGRG